jgi:hypothetical protein
MREVQVVLAFSTVAGVVVIDASFRLRHDLAPSCKSTSAELFTPISYH